MTDPRSHFERVEVAVREQVPFRLRHVADSVEQRRDARLEQALSTAPPRRTAGSR